MVLTLARTASLCPTDKRQKADPLLGLGSHFQEEEEMGEAAQPILNFILFLLGMQWLEFPVTSKTFDSKCVKP